MLKQDSKLVNKPVASSHLFHTDTTGSKIIHRVNDMIYLHHVVSVAMPGNPVVVNEQPDVQCISHC